MTTTRHLSNLDSAKKFIRERVAQNAADVTAGKKTRTGKLIELIKHPHLCDIRDGENVILQCDTKADVYTWYLLYTSPVTGKRNQKKALGRFDLGVTPKLAHKEADRIRSEFLALGLDPNLETRVVKEAEKTALVIAKQNKKLAAAGKAPVNSFLWLADEVHAEDSQKWKGNTATDFTNAMERYIRPTFGLKQLADITWAGDVKPMQDFVLAGGEDGIERGALRSNSRGNKSALQKVMRFANKVFDEALLRELIVTKPVVEAPRHLERIAPPPTVHHAATTSWSDLGLLMKQLSDIKDDMVVETKGKGNKKSRAQARDALLISLATVQRRGTVIAMKWENLDIDVGGLGLWFIPRSSLGEDGQEVAGTMKGKKVLQETPGLLPEFHVVPLPQLVIDMLRQIRAQQEAAGIESAYVFPNRCTSRGDWFMGSTQMSTLLNDLGWKKKITQHGMRTTLKTLLADHLGATPTLPGTEKTFDIHLAVEIQLDHTHGKRMMEVTSNMPGTYFKGDLEAERTYMMNLWADKLQEAYKAACEAAKAAPAQVESPTRPRLAHAAFLKRLAA